MILEQPFVVLKKLIEVPLAEANLNNSVVVQLMKPLQIAHFKLTEALSLRVKAWSFALVPQQLAQATAP